MKKTIKKIAMALLAVAPFCANAQNPYLPMWEYIPDGEPYVFEDPDKPGEYRVYVYGSHDNLLKYYCGRDQVVWSASVNDLTNWRYDGIIFESKMGPDGRPLNADGEGDVLYAPDVAVKVDKDGNKKYYLYPNNQAWGRNGQVAVSDRPDGPFTTINWSKDNPTVCDGVLQFDPGVFVDDDGRVYGYWGFGKSHGAELDPTTMATVKPGCQVIEYMIPSFEQDDKYRFFEASSMRKIEDKYVFIYSRMTKDGDFGMPQVNYTLAYCYSDNPLGPWTYGGTIIDGRARDVDDNGKPTYTADPFGNTHGSICQINGQWWVFYHRQSDQWEYNRQPMVAPITVKVEKGKGGKVTISEAEYTSEGFQINGLNPLYKSKAGWACYYTQPNGVNQEYPYFYHSGPYVKASRVGDDVREGLNSLRDFTNPVVNTTNGSTVGYKYFNFDCTSKADNVTLKAHFKPEGLVDGTITVYVGGPKESRGGKKIGEFSIKKTDKQEITEFSIPVSGLKGIKGKQPLFFAFKASEDGKSLCEMYDFWFEIK